MLLPVISQFYGIIIQMFFDEKKKHHKEHIHVRYNEYEIVYDLNGNILEGNLPNKQKKLVEAWMSYIKKIYKVCGNSCKKKVRCLKLNL